MHTDMTVATFKPSPALPFRLSSMHIRSMSIPRSCQYRYARRNCGRITGADSVMPGSQNSESRSVSWLHSVPLIVASDEVRDTEFEASLRGSKSTLEVYSEAKSWSINPRCRVISERRWCTIKVLCASFAASGSEMFK